MKLDLKLVRQILLSIIKKSFSWHFYSLYNYLDPISTGFQKFQSNTCQSSKWNFNLLFPALILVFSMFYSYIINVYLETGQINLTTIPQSSMVLFHQIFPPAIWHQTDMLAFIGVIEALFIYASFLPHTYTINRYTHVKIRKRRTPELQVGKNGKNWTKMIFLNNY